MATYRERHHRSLFRHDALPPRDIRRIDPALVGDPLMTNIFAVVGEHRDDPDHLLVLGEDGSYYDYTVTTGHTAPTEPDPSWTTDAEIPDLDEVLGR